MDEYGFREFDSRKVNLVVWVGLSAAAALVVGFSISPLLALILLVACLGLTGNYLMGRRTWARPIPVRVPPTTNGESEVAVAA